MKLFQKSIITKEEAKRFLIDNTHAGVWQCKPKYSFFNKTMTIDGPADAAEISLITGHGEYFDNDFDGCCSDGSHKFKVIRKLNGNLKKIKL